MEQERHDVSTAMLTRPRIEVARLEREIKRLRTSLLEAWECGRPTLTIRRLEDALRKRWRLLDESRYLL